MAVGNFDGVDLWSVPLDGMIHEEVLNRIIDATPTDTPFLSAIGSSSVGNDLYEWPMERLADPVIDQQREDGSGGRGDESKVGIRVRNYSEIRTKTIITSTRANELNTIGFARALVRQLSRRGLELSRDWNATLLSNNSSVAPADGVAPRTAGLHAWITSKVLNPTAADSAATPTYSDGENVWDANAAAVDTGTNGWPNQTGGLVPSYDIAATLGALTETAIRTVANSVWKLGNNPTRLHAVPEVISLLSQYMFTSSARIATLIADGGGAASTRKASGSVNEFLTDFGVSLSFIPDRQMNLMTDGTNTGDVVYIFDPNCVESVSLMGRRVKPLASDGLWDKREMAMDGGLKVLDWHGIGAITNVDRTAAVTA